DPEAFALMKRQLESSVANRLQDPGNVFGERLEQLNSCNHYTSQPVTPESIATLNPQTMLNFYRQRCANAADFTMFVVGAFNKDAVIAQLARWVGSLPSAGTRSAQFRNLNLCFPATTDRVVVEKGREPRSQTVMSFFADVPSEPIEQ